MRRKLFVMPLLVASLAFTSAAARAHVFVAPTALSIQLRGGPVDPGETVTITGRLAGRPACRANQRIDLVQNGVGVVATTTTDASGFYRFQVTVTEDTAFRTRFSGSASGVHPHSHVCAGSSSRLLRVKVRGPDVLGEAGTQPGNQPAGDTITGVPGTALSGSDFLPFAVAAGGLLIAGMAAVLITRRRSG
jgi:hypothetical protein